MTNQQSDSGFSGAEHRQRMAHALERLDERIARLALALGVPLKTEADVEAVLSRTPAPKAGPWQRAVGEGSFSLAASDAGWRSAIEHRELQGLLVLRYDLERQYAEEVGPAATLKLLLEAEQQLNAEGFSPGADGFIWPEGSTPGSA